MDDVIKYSSGEVFKPEYGLVERGIGVDANLAERLMRIADDARKNSYSPYSKYKVGAALLCKDGNIFTGTNVETAAFTGICAERNAVFAAVAEGRKSFVAMAISGGKGDEPSYCAPCGICRQVLTEFVTPNEFMVIFRTDENTISTIPLAQLLPYSFNKDNLV